ncbi:MAG: 5'-nucleotidase C-terminal domain-containing protein [Bacteroidales bacterium]|nr:5'-nucleotidase C-terminal domain-containing protein [Bacteroidales bacterium]
MKLKQLLTIGLAASAVLSCSRTLKDGIYELQVLSTNDVHSTWFDSTYVGGGVKKSLYAMNHYIDSVRNVYGFDNVALIDAGDCLQGDNAAYYFNYVDTLSPHLFPRLMGYMKYDAIAVGNHDIETGHPVYDRVTKDLESYGAPFLAANAIRTDNGKAYFPEYKVFTKAGLRIAVIGYTNANIKAWLTEELWSGMDFELIMNQVQADVDRVRAKEKPDVMIVAMHSGCGHGDGKIRENEALDVFNSVRGVDFLVCGHDHRPNVITRDSTALLNSGSHSRFVAHGTLKMEVKDGAVVSKTFATELIKVKAENADTVMRAHFQKDYEAVKAFTVTPVGVLNTELRTRDSYKGMSDYINLIHTVSLGCSPAEISFAAPLTYNGTVKQGVLLYNDLFTIYPFENQLFVVTMSGQEIKNYLEKSYDQWINTISGPGDHILKIQNYDDPRTQQKGWSFIGRSYNFDSAAGINYTVDVTKPFGERIDITTLASGAEFDLAKTYNVAMTSYRASGGGNLLREGAGIDTEHIGDRTVARYPEIREIIYQYLQKNGSIDPEVIGNPAVIGKWRFTPAALADPAMERDMKLLFK